MKALPVILVAVILIVAGGGFYFSMPKDKCSKVVCSSDEQCSPLTGVCESRSDVLNRIEASINQELNSPMNRIESAIQQALR